MMSLRPWAVVLIGIAWSVTGWSNGAKQPPLRVLSSQQFCTNMIRAFATSNLVQGETKEQVAQAQMAAFKLHELLRAGTLSHIVPISQLGLTTDTQEKELRRFVNLQTVLSQSFGTGEDFILAFRVDELRYLPSVKPGGSVLLIINEAAALTPERARMVTGLAQKQGIRLSFAWYGPMHEAGIREATGLAFLSGVTNGLFVDLNGPSLCKPSGA